MAGALRFSLFGSLGDALRPLWRAPVALALVVVPLMLLAGAAAALEALYASGAGLWPWVGRAVNRLYFIGLDVTLGSAIVLVGLAALDGTPINRREIIRRSAAALPAVLLMSLVGNAVWLVAALFVLNPIGGESEAGYSYYSLIQLISLAVSIVMATTLGQVAFAALTGSGFGPAFARGWALVRRARWKLGLLALLAWVIDTIAGDLFNLLTSLMVGDSRPVLHDAVSQAIYILWYALTMLLTAAVGRRLAQVEATRNPDLLADTFD